MALLLHHVFLGIVTCQVAVETVEAEAGERCGIPSAGLSLLSLRTNTVKARQPPDVVGHVVGEHIKGHHSTKLHAVGHAPQALADKKRALLEENIKAASMTATATDESTTCCTLYDSTCCSPMPAATLIDHVVYRIPWYFWALLVLLLIVLLFLICWIRFLLGAQASVAQRDKVSKDESAPRTMPYVEDRAVPVPKSERVPTPVSRTVPVPQIVEKRLPSEVFRTAAPIPMPVVQPVPTAVTMPTMVAPPMATVGLDTNHDGHLNYFYTGADLNHDGIPDAMQAQSLPPHRLVPLGTSVCNLPASPPGTILVPASDAGVLPPTARAPLVLPGSGSFPVQNASLEVFSMLPREVLSISPVVQAPHSVSPRMQTPHFSTNISMPSVDNAIPEVQTLPPYPSASKMPASDGSFRLPASHGSFRLPIGSTMVVDAADADTRVFPTIAQASPLLPSLGNYRQSSGNYPAQNADFEPLTTAPLRSGQYAPYPGLAM
jgi:hypothetical protein